MEIAQTVAISAPDGPAPAPQAGTALAGLFARFLSALLGPDAGDGAASLIVAQRAPSEAADEGSGSPAEARPAAATLPAVPPDVAASWTAPDGEAPRAPDKTGTAGDEAAAPEEAVTMAAAFCAGVAPDGSNPRAINQSGEQPPAGQSEAALTGVVEGVPGPLVAPDRSMPLGTHHTGPPPTAGLPLHVVGAEQLPLQAGAVAGVNVVVDREIPHRAAGRVKQPGGDVILAAQPGRSPLAPAGTEHAVPAMRAGARALQEVPVLTLAGASAVGAQTGKPSLQPPAQGTSLLPEAKTAPTGPPAAGGAQSPPPTPGQDVAAGHRAAPASGIPDTAPETSPAPSPASPVSPGMRHTAAAPTGSLPLYVAGAGRLPPQAGAVAGANVAAGREIPGGPQGAVGQAAAGVPGPRAGLENMAGDRFRGTPTGLRENAVAGPLNGPAPVTTATPPAGPQPLTAQLAVAVVRHIEQLQQHPGRPLRIEIALEPPELGRVTVRLSLIRGELTAQFYTGDVFARDALAASLPQLREALAQHNIWLGQAHVFLGQDGRAGHAPYTWTGRGFGLGPGGGAEAPVPEANTRPDYDARLLNYLV
ncbi:MAG: flagellar hook-length control protein FliK [Desulfotomaculales bacterium]